MNPYQLPHSYFRQPNYQNRNESQFVLHLTFDITGNDLYEPSNNEPPAQDSNFYQPIAPVSNARNPNIGSRLNDPYRPTGNTHQAQKKITHRVALNSNILNQKIDHEEEGDINNHEKPNHEHRSALRTDPNRVPNVDNSNRRIGCRCGKSKCLRLHCRCFRNLDYCAKFCKCINCFNVIEQKEARDFIISKTQEIYKNSFKSKFKKINDDDGNEIINMEGCNCKTGCDRNYCDCFKNSLACSTICKCANCTNRTVFLPTNDVQKIMKYCTRKKTKIIIEDILPMSITKPDSGSISDQKIQSSTIPDKGEVAQESHQNNTSGDQIEES
jgi:hypothetical protein